jgi:hypothetical protein
LVTLVCNCHGRRRRRRLLQVAIVSRPLFAVRQTGDGSGGGGGSSNIGEELSELEQNYSSWTDDKIAAVITRDSDDDS